MNSYPYPSPPSLGHHGQAATLSATEEAVAFVALLSRQRSSSFDNSFGPEAKRARSNTPPAAAPIEPVSLQRWLQSVSTPPLDTAAATTNSVPTTAALSHSLSDLEYSHAWSYLPPSSASEAATGFEGFTAATGAESFDYQSQQRLNGVQTNFHPTPVTTPQPQSCTSSVTNAAIGRPVNLRSTTAPVAPSRSLAEIKLAAGQVGAQFGAEIEMRARGEHEQQRQAQAQQVQRSSTDPGLKVGAGDVPNKDRFVAGLVGESHACLRESTSRRSSALTLRFPHAQAPRYSQSSPSGVLFPPTRPPSRRTAASSPSTGSLRRSSAARAPRARPFNSLFTTSTSLVARSARLSRAPTLRATSTAASKSS